MYISVRYDSHVYWTIATTRQQFSELVRVAADEPQVVTNRNQPVAVVIGAELYEEFQRWQQGRRRTLFEACQELRQICHDEGYELPLAARGNRANPFPAALE